MSAYTRSISVNVEEITPELLKAFATMENKIGGFSTREYFKIELEVSKNDFEIKSITNVIVEGFFPMCCHVIPILQNIVGLQIKPGYSKKLAELAGGKEGCTHIVELLTEIGRCIYQTHHTQILKAEGFEVSLAEYKLNSNIPCLGLSSQMSQGTVL